MAVILLFAFLVAASAVGTGMLIGLGVLRIGRRRGLTAAAQASSRVWVEWAAIAAGAAVAGGLMAMLLFGSRG